MARERWPAAADIGAATDARSPGKGRNGANCGGVKRAGKYARGRDLFDSEEEERGSASEDTTCGSVRRKGAKMRAAVATNAAARTAATAADTQGAAAQSKQSSGAKAPAKRSKALRGEVVLVVGRRVRERGRDRSRLGAGAQREDSATCVGVGRGAFWRRELAGRSILNACGAP